MTPCRRVGLDITWRCQWACRQCFYLRSPEFHAAKDIPLPEITAKIDAAAAHGFDHAVMTGYGEPSLARNVLEVLAYCRERGLATSMITNAATGLRRIENFAALGIDHLHISTHGIGETLAKITGDRGAHEKQIEVKEWLAAKGIRYRMNVAMQRLNFRELPALAKQEIGLGCYHFVFLGFLPHYEWRDHVRSVAVDPRELRPYIEEAAALLREAGVLFTIRYHPLCLLDPALWPFVTNARFVYFDPWEWNYTLRLDPEPLWEAAKALGDSVACSEPCSECEAREHCGGWNRIYAEAFEGAGLTPVLERPKIYPEAVWRARGGLHDLNPANSLAGTIGRD